MLIANRAQWLNQRAKGIGASESAAILGVSPWKSSLQLFYEKKGIEPGSKGEQFARRLGLEMEGPIARLYGEEVPTRKVLRAPDGQFDLQTHKTLPYMVATLDGRVVIMPEDAMVGMRGQQAVLEIKTAAITKAAVWQDEPPIDYQVQVQHQLAVTGLDWGVLVALVGGVSLRYADIKRDQEFINLLEAAVIEWWRRFELNDPPPPDGTEATKDFLRRLYPSTVPESVTLPPEALEWDDKLQRAKADMDEAKSRKLEAENNLKVMLGENVAGILPNGVIYTWKTIPRAGYTVQPTTYRDFRRKATAAEKVGKAKAKPMPALTAADIQKAFTEQQARENEERGDARD